MSAEISDWSLVFVFSEIEFSFSGLIFSQFFLLQNKNCFLIECLFLVLIKFCANLAKYQQLTRGALWRLTRPRLSGPWLAAPVCRHQETTGDFTPEKFGIFERKHSHQKAKHLPPTHAAYYKPTSPLIFTSQLTRKSIFRFSYIIFHVIFEEN